MKGKSLIAAISFIFGFVAGIRNDLYSFIITLVPTRIEFQVGSIGAIIGAITFRALGKYDDTLDALLILMTLDVITGVWASCKSKVVLLNSNKGFKGISKKFGVICMVVISYKFGQALPVVDPEALKDFVACAYCSVEVLSIVENLAKCGVPIPIAVQSKLEQLAVEKIERRRLLENESDRLKRFKDLGGPGKD